MGLMLRNSIGVARALLVAAAHKPLTLALRPYVVDSQNHSRTRGSDYRCHSNPARVLPIAEEQETEQDKRAETDSDLAQKKSLSLIRHHTGFAEPDIEALYGTSR